MAINETFARRIQAEGGDPLRSRFLVLGNVRQVVAVVTDVKHRSLDSDSGREVYIPIAQAPAFFQSYDLVVRAANPISLVPAIRAAIWDIDPNQALGTPVALDEYVGEPADRASHVQPEPALAPQARLVAIVPREGQARLARPAGPFLFGGNPPFAAQLNTNPSCQLSISFR
jgi:hypothetical protein